MPRPLPPKRYDERCPLIRRPQHRWCCLIRIDTPEIKPLLLGCPESCAIKAEHLARYEHIT